MIKATKCPHCGEINKYNDAIDVKKSVHFYGHEMQSAILTKQIMTRLKYPTDVINAVVVAIKNHMRTKSFGKDAELVSDKALRKLMNDLGDHLDSVLDVIHADNISHGDEANKWQHNLPNQVDAIKKKMKELGDFTGRLKLPIDGNDVINLIKRENPNFKPNKVIADTIDAVREKFLENPKLTKQEAEKIVIDTYRELNK